MSANGIVLRALNEGKTFAFVKIHGSFIQQLRANSCSIFLQLDHLFVTEFFAYIQYLLTGNHLFLPLQGIIISSHIKTIEQSNVTITYRYILKLMIGSGLKDYHPGETI